jgi:adenylate cyclase
MLPADSSATSRSGHVLPETKSGRYGTVKRWPAIVLALFVSGVVGSLIWTTPIGQRLETDVGLAWAFKLRGPSPPAPEPLVVPINDVTASVLSQPPIDRLDQWDRRQFALLVDRLNDAGASVIAFDVAFLRKSEDAAADELFSSAIRRAGNVILLQWLTQQRPDPVAGSGFTVNLDSLTEPTPALARVAAGVAPWPLYKDARTNRFPAFPAIAGRIAPTLPVAALHLYQRNHIESLRHCASDWNRGTTLAPAGGIDRPDTLSAEILTLRERLLAAQREPPPDSCRQPLVRSLVRTYRAGPEIHFNYYGGPGTLAGPAMHEWLGPESSPFPTDIAGKAIFVGVAEYSSVQQTDAFYTVFRSRRGDTDIAGVELAAVAFANLLHGNHIKPATPVVGLVILMAFGALVGLTAFWLPVRFAITSVLFISILYLASAHYLFSKEHLWLPLALPLLLQSPLAVAVGWRLRFLQARRLKEAYRSAVEHYVPVHIADRIERVGHLGTTPEPLYGICMHSDIAGYTTLAERLAAKPAALKALENEYWELLGEEIYRQGGQMLEIAGDGMTCIWAAKLPDPGLNQRTCRAAVQMLRAVERFNQRHPDTPFPTRIGIHAGQVALGNVGGGGHYTWAVGGDIANTAARLESDLNKLMHTRMVVSEHAAPELSGSETLEFRLRGLGRFLLRGKRNIVAVHELIDPDLQPIVAADGFLERFQLGLMAFEATDWLVAKGLFGQILALCPGDGPAEFYHRLSTLYLEGREQPSTPHSPGLIDMNLDWVGVK